ncbi:amino acid permease [Streptomyces sp. NPDC002659]|uniref:amino acid permease n=1 Tax=Streptomyces sp. NPDC002659 TaxID=3364656 RepID=UPI0036CA3ADC
MGESTVWNKIIMHAPRKSVSFEKLGQQTGTAAVDTGKRLDSSGEPCQISQVADLTEFGYRQELSRSLGGFSAFAAGFSFVSILTTAFQLFGLGYSFGGSRFFWTWPVVLAGQFLVALCFAELAARFPLTGSVYQWAKYVGGGFTGWLAGWMMLIGCIVAFGAAAIALQVVLPSVWKGFQIVGGESAVTSSSGAANAVLLGLVLIAFTTAANAAGVRIVSRINDAGVIAELTGLAVLIGGLAVAAVRGPGVVTADHHASTASPGMAGLFMAALMPAYVMYGFDNAASVAEETRGARRTAPRAILRSLALSGLIGMAVLLLALMAAPSLTDGRLALEGLPYVIYGVFGGLLGKVLLADVAVAVLACALTIQTGTIRLFYAMGRDGALPFSRQLARVNVRTGTPLWPALISGTLASGLLLVNLGNPSLFAVLAGTSVVIVYIAYLLVTGPLLIRRVRGQYPRSAAGDFSLKGFGLPITAAAVAYGVLMAVNIAWPRAEVYDPAGSGRSWSLLLPVVFVTVAIAAGWLCWTVLRRTSATPRAMDHPQNLAATIELSGFPPTKR